jgi:hypothetical protein
MKLAKTLLGTAGALLLATSGGCIFFIGDNDTGDVEFDYVLLVNDNGAISAATSCDDFRLPSDIATIRVMLGNDRNFDGILDDGEIDEDGFTDCNQFDEDFDGFIDPNNSNGFNELGVFSAEFGTGGRDIFAVEFLDFNGDAIPWQTFDTNQNFTRFSFSGGVTVLEDTINVLAFAGDRDPNNNIPNQGDIELQSFFGF